MQNRPGRIVVAKRNIKGQIGIVCNVDSCGATKHKSGELILEEKIDRDKCQARVYRKSALICISFANNYQQPLHTET
jgi:hypothetical protein